MNPPLDFRQTARRWHYATHKSVTIVALANRDVVGHEKAMLQTESCLPRSCRKLMISPVPPKSRDMEWVPDDDWGEGREKVFSRLGEWTLKKLAALIATDFVILVQADGYALNKQAWTDEFLEYDYIGAPWPLWLTVCMQGSMFRRVGGAGFSLRSRKFLETTAAMDYSPELFWQEDIATSRIYHRALEKAGCYFAPVRLALKWCVEYRLEDYPRWRLVDSFGFHGRTRWGDSLHNLTHLQGFYGAVKQKITGTKP